jgi:hypothetical protein
MGCPVVKVEVRGFGEDECGVREGGKKRRGGEVADVSAPITAYIIISAETSIPRRCCQARTGGRLGDDMGRDEEEENENEGMAHCDPLQGGEGGRGGAVGRRGWRRGRGGDD